ncbi:hypothetical protein EDE12_11142 [Methylosinus sp. sav-2]|nr:hypothetical protein EDE12_11142 [Methylosinus sp. sav-2]
MRHISDVISICAIGLSVLLLRQGVILAEAEGTVERYESRVKVEAHSKLGAATRSVDDELLAELTAFRNTDGVATRLLDLRAVSLTNVGDDDRFSRAILDLVARAPTSAMAWMELAKFQWRNSAPLERVLEALQMSKVTAPHEARIIESRVLFSSAIWEFLPSEGRRSVVSQLIELNGRINERIRSRLAAILIAKQEGTRKDIVGDLRARGAADSPWVRAIGLGL